MGGKRPAQGMHYPGVSVSYDRTVRLDADFDTAVTPYARPSSIRASASSPGST
ncbi:hypothetical protein BKA18_002233 [Streptomyces auratus]